MSKSIKVGEFVRVLGGAPSPWTWRKIGVVVGFSSLENPLVAFASSETRGHNGNGGVPELTGFDDPHAKNLWYVAPFYLEKLGYTLGDKVKVVSDFGCWTTGLQGTVVGWSNDSPMFLLVEFSDADAQGRGHDGYGAVGIMKDDDSECRWFVDKDDVEPVPAEEKAEMKTQALCVDTRVLADTYDWCDGLEGVIKYVDVDQVLVEFSAHDAAGRGHSGHSHGFTDDVKTRWWLPFDEVSVAPSRAAEVSIADELKVTPQARKVLAHLKRHGHITPLKADAVYGIRRLASCIHEIRHKTPYGVNMRVLKDDSGHKYAYYTLVLPAAEAA